MEESSSGWRMKEEGDDGYDGRCKDHLKDDCCDRIIGPIDIGAAAMTTTTTTTVDSLVVTDVPFSNYDPNVVPPTTPVSNNTTKVRWTVRRGDLVAVHLAGSTPPPRRKGRGRWHPFVVPWSAGEVVDIFIHNNPPAGGDAVENGDGDGEGGHGGQGRKYTLTVRWFYRRGDMPPEVRSSLPRPRPPARPSKSAKRSATLEDENEEDVWRSDEITEGVDATSLLGPAALRSAGGSFGYTGTCAGIIFPRVALACRGRYDVERGEVTSTAPTEDDGATSTSVVDETNGGGTEDAIGEERGGITTPCQDGGSMIGSPTNEREPAMLAAVAVTTTPCRRTPRRGGVRRGGGGDRTSPSWISSSMGEMDDGHDRDDRPQTPSLDSVMIRRPIPYANDVVVGMMPQRGTDAKEDVSGGMGWSVRVGDAVAVHMVDSTPPPPPPSKNIIPAAAAAKGDDASEKVMHRSGNKWHPFEVPWSPAEVVRILPPRRPKDDGANGEKCSGGGPSSSSNNSCTVVVVEVRWLYRPGDVPSDAVGWNNGGGLSSRDGAEEVLRSNHVDVVDQTSLLGPVRMLPPSATEEGRRGPGQDQRQPWIPKVWCARFYDADSNEVGDLASTQVGAATMGGSEERPMAEEDEKRGGGNYYSSSGSTEKHCAITSSTSSEKCHHDGDRGGGTAGCSSPVATGDVGHHGHPPGLLAVKSSLVGSDDGCCSDDDLGGGSHHHHHHHRRVDDGRRCYDDDHRNGDDFHYGEICPIVPGGSAVTAVDSLVVTDVPFSNYDPNVIVPPTSTTDKVRWVVRRGDVVAVHLVGSTPPPRRKGRGRWHPFVVPWSAGEIVGIHLHGGSGDDDVENDDDPKDGEGCGGPPRRYYTLTVRWFYRRGDMPPDVRDSLPRPARPSKPATKKSDDGRARADLEFDGEEVWRSDEITEGVEATSLLGPATLHSAGGGGGTTGGTVGCQIMDTGIFFPRVALACRGRYDVERGEVVTVATSGSEEATRPREGSRSAPTAREVLMAASAVDEDDVSETGQDVIGEEHGGTIIITTTPYYEDRVSRLSVSTNEEPSMVAVAVTTTPCRRTPRKAGGDRASPPPTSSTPSSTAMEGDDGRLDHPTTSSLESVLIQRPIPYSNADDGAKEEGDRIGWSVRPGDVVAVHMVDSTPPPPDITAAAAAGGNDPTKKMHRRGRWHPFEVPWSPAEVVRIFPRSRRLDDDHDSSDPSSSGKAAVAGAVTVEVRWLYRPGDVPSNAIGWNNGEGPSPVEVVARGTATAGSPFPAPATPPLGAEEVLWSNHVDGVELTSLLGPVRMLPPPPSTPSSSAAKKPSWPPGDDDVTLQSQSQNHRDKVPSVWCRMFYDADSNEVRDLPSQEEVIDVTDGSERWMTTMTTEKKTSGEEVRSDDSSASESAVVPMTTPVHGGGGGGDERRGPRTGDDDHHRDHVSGRADPSPSGGSGEGRGDEDLGDVRAHRRELESVVVRDPPFSNYDLPRDVPLPNTGAEATWTVRGGDTVAVHVETSTPPDRRRSHAERGSGASGNRWHPFLVPWNPAQLVRIWREDEDEDGDGGGTCMVEVRWLYRRAEVPRDAFKLSSAESNPEAVEELPEDADYDEEVYISNHTDVLELSSLLGPARLLLPVPRSGKSSHARSDTGTSTGGGGGGGGGIFPDVVLACRQFYDRDENTVTSIPPGVLSSIHERAMVAEEENTMSDDVPANSDLVVDGPNEGMGDDHSSSTTSLGRTKSGAEASTASVDAPSTDETKGPIDSSPSSTERSGDQHKDSIVIRDPPFSNYDHFSPPPLGTNSTEWTVRVGDAVAVHLEGSTRPRRKSRHDGSDSDSEWHPFTVPWSPGEVVGIVRSKPSDVGSCDSPGQDGPDDGAGGGRRGETPPVGAVGYVVRVRWLFRVSEVPRDARRTEGLSDGETVIPGAAPTEPPDVEEVLRSNEVDEVEISSLLGPVRLILPGGGSYETVSSTSSPRSSVDAGSFSTNSIFPDVPLSCRQFYDRDANTVTPIRGEECSTGDDGGKKDANHSATTTRHEHDESSRKRKREDAAAATATASGVEKADEHPNGAPPAPTTFVSVPSGGKVDKSKRRVHHDCIVVHDPPVSNYRFPPPPSPPASLPQERTWSIKCGDAVAVHSDESVPPIYFSENGDRIGMGSGGKWHPFTVPWSPAEVEKIWFRPKKPSPPPKSGGEVIPSEGRGPVSKDNFEITKSRLVDGVDGKFMVRVRWLYRRGNLPKTLRRRYDPIPPSLLSEREEVIRTNHLDTVELSSLLGPAILLDPSSGGAVVKPHSDDCFLPSVVLMWRQYYHRDRGQVEQVHDLCSSSTGTERDGKNGDSLSADGGDQQQDEMGSSSKKKRKHPPSSDENTTLVVGSSSAAEEENSTARGSGGTTTSFPFPPILTENSSHRHRRRTFHKSIVVHDPPFSNYETRPALTGGEEVSWHLKCGDTVAVHLEDSSPPSTGRGEDEDGDGEDAEESHVWRPFTVPWSPAEIVTMWVENLVEGSDACSKRLKGKQDSSKRGRDENSRVMMEVRWLYRRGDLERGALAEEYSPSARTSNVEVVYESNFLQNVEVKSLLGPVQLQFSHSVTTERQGCGVKKSSIFPEVTLRWGGYYRTQDHRVYNFETRSMNELIERGRDASELLKIHKPLRRLLAEEAEQLRQIAGGDNDKMPNDGEEIGSVGTSRRVVDGSAGPLNPTTLDKDSRNSLRVETPDEPVYVDVASGKAYHLHARLKPHFPAYATLSESEASELLRTSEFRWNVRVGDVVNLHYDYEDWRRDHAARKKKEGGGGEEYDWYPFHAVWSPAEVLAIWRNVSREEGATLRRQGNAHTEDGIDGGGGDDAVKVDEEHGNGQVMLEVRWMYTKELLPIDAPSSSETSDQQLEEVFETDHVQPIKADCLLSPCRLSSNSTGTVPSDNMRFEENGVPEPEFHCHRFWSVHRRALVPCGALAHRVERGMVHSREYSKNRALKSAVEEALRKEKPQRFATLASGQVEGSVYDDDARCADIWTDERKHQDEKQLRKLLADAASGFTLSSAAYDANSKGVPLQGRENEHRKIAEFLRAAIRSTRGTLFCAGPPGTGKTASIKSVVAQLRDEQANGKLPDFSFVAINGMELRHPFDAYVSFWEAIKEDKLSPGAAAACLENHFGEHQNGKLTEEQIATTERPVTVLLLDEIDYLVTSKQTLLYNLFSWPMQAGRNGLVVIGISNTLNLPERLHPRVQSRLGKERCMFHSYGVNDIVNILKTRLSLGKHGPCNRVFEDDAITFAARKTAAKSGDIRRAFHMCRSAAESVISEIDSGTRPASSERGGGHMVRILDMQKATRAKLDSPLLRAVSMSTTFEALTLVSLASLRSQSGRERGSSGVHELLDKMHGVASSLGDPKYLPIPTFNELLEMLTRMGEGRLLLLRTPKMTHVWPLIELNMDEFDLHVALKSTPHQKLADKNLCSHNF